MPPVVAAAGIAAAATVGGAVLSSKSQKKAANTAANAATQNTNANNALARDIYNQNASRLDPYASQGVLASNQINELLGLSPASSGALSAFDKYRQSTGYNFRLNQGTDAINSGYAAGGLLQSGAAQKALLRYGQDYGTGAFNDYLGQLGNIRNTGLGAASALAGVGQSFAGQVTTNNNNAADAVANAALLRGTANGQLWQGIAGGIGTLAGSLGSSYGGGVNMSALNNTIAMNNAWLYK
jgi:hypothetical protein